MDEELLALSQEIWRPFAAAGNELGFRFLEERAWFHDPRALSGGAHLYRDDGVFLDIFTLVAIGRPPRGTRPGFNGIQLYSWVDDGELEMILTNGSPPYSPVGTSGLFVDRIMALFPRQREPEPIVTTPEEIGGAIERHLQKLHGRNVLLPAGDVLKQRWAWCDALGLGE